MTTENNHGRNPEDVENDQGIGDAGFAGMGDAAVNGSATGGNDAQTPRDDDGGVAGDNGESQEEAEERLRLTNEANSRYDYLTSRQWGPENLFDILDLDPNEASEAEVVAAHRRLLELLHPDKGLVKDHVASQVLNDLYAPWKKKRDDEHSKKVKDAEAAGKAKPRKTASKAKGSGRKFGGYMATSNMPPRDSGDWTRGYASWGDFDEPFSRDFDEDFFGARHGESEQRWGYQEPEPENGGFDEETPPPQPGGGFGDTTRHFWQNYNADTANARNVRRLNSIFGPSFANFIGDFVGIGDASNLKATISANAAYRVYDAARNNWDGMSRLARGASAAGLGFLASNAFTGGWHEKGNLFAAATGATYGAVSESRAGDWVKDNLTKGGSVVSGARDQLRDKWENAEGRSRNIITAGLGWFATAEVSNILNWPKGGFNHLTAAASAAAVSGLTYGGFKLKDKWDAAADDATKKKYKRNALVGMGAVAVGVVGLAAYRYGWIPGVGGKSGNSVADTVPTTTPRSGNSSTSLANQVSSTTQAPSGNTSSSILTTSTTAPNGSTTSTSTTILTAVPVPGGKSGSSNIFDIANFRAKNRPGLISKIQELHPQITTEKASKVASSILDKQVSALESPEAARRFQKMVENGQTAADNMFKQEIAKQVSAA